MDGALPEIILFKAASGFQSAMLRWPSGSTRLLHSAVSPESEAADLPLPEIWGDVVLCLGTGLGYHLKPLCDSKVPKLVILCDCRPELLQASVQRLSGSSHVVVEVLLRDGRVSDQVEQSVRRLWNGPGLPRIQVLRHPASYRMASSDFERFAEKLFQGWAFGAKPEKPRGALPRVLLLHGLHFLQEELRNALLELQADFQVLDLEGDHGFGDWESKVLQGLQQFRPDMVLSVNMKGIDSDGVLMDCARRLGIEVHAWFVDDPRPIALACPARYHPWIQAWSWERAYLPWLKQKGFINPRWLPLAGDPKLFAPAPAQGEAHLGIVFTGSSMGRDYLDRIKRSFMWDERLAPLVEMRALELLQGRRGHGQLLEGLPLPFQDERNRCWLECLIQHNASNRKRLQVLAPLVVDDLVCAGDAQGWREALGPAVKVIPDINYRKGLAEHYARCAVNLNVTSCQMPAAVNQRVFDVPLVGGFLLTDMQSDLQELFAPTEVLTYASAEDAGQKARWYLEHSSERDKLAFAARARILGVHTYAHRLREMFRLRAT